MARPSIKPHKPDLSPLHCLSALALTVGIAPSTFAQDSPLEGTLDLSADAAPPAGLLELTVESLPVIYDEDTEPGRILSMSHDWKADFGPQGLDFTPILGSSAPVDQITSFKLRSVTRGGEALAFLPGVVSRSNDSVTLDRDSLREVYHLSTETVEQTFVFNELPGDGDLVIEVGVETPWQVVADGESIRMVDPRFGEVTYGKAFAFDANGSSISIKREWTGNGIELTVPAYFLAGAVLPLTIDPPIGVTYSIPSFGSPLEAPDAAYDSNSGKFWFVFERDVSASNTDVICVAVRPDGTDATAIAIDISTTKVFQPSIAMAPAYQRGLIACSGILFGNNQDIFSFGLNTTAETRDAASEILTIVSSYKYSEPQVGGSWDPFGAFLGSWDFFVVWKAEIAPGTTFIEGVFKDAFPGSTSAAVAVVITGDDVSPTISKSRGRGAAPYWHVAWLNDPNVDFVGQPYARSYNWAGVPATPAGFPLSSITTASRVRVSSSFDEPLAAIDGGNNIPPFLAAYNSNSPDPNGIFVTVCDFTGPLGSTYVSELEDFDQGLHQGAPSIATDGLSFFLSYMEQDAGGGALDTTIYMTSGEIVGSAAGPTLALSERHSRVAGPNISGRQVRGVIASRFDGGGNTDQAAVMWENGPSFAKTLMFNNIETATSSPLAAPAVGVQYCDANGHGSSAFGGRESSWLSIFGTRQVTGTHTLIATDMPLGTFGFFICSLNSGNTNMPGGSAGRLCLSGTIGRRVGGVVASTGSSGSIGAQFSPLVLPVPNGTVSASPGETWYFQAWHRDVVGGINTSNFTNACSVLFLP